MPESRRIQISDGGPYVVEGGVPLKAMTPAHTMNGEPIAWHVLGELDPGEEPYYLCRCGRSGNKPFCDSSHEREPWNSAAPADRAAASEHEAVIEWDDATLLDNKSLCIHAGFCRTRTADIWNLFAENTPESRARAKEMIWLCPSGRVAQYDAEADQLLEPDLPEEIAVIPGGPLWVRGGVLVEAVDGSLFPTRNRQTLCRCGASANKPYCDGTHVDLAFDER